MKTTVLTHRPEVAKSEFDPKLRLTKGGSLIVKMRHNSELRSSVRSRFKLWMVRTAEAIGWLSMVDEKILRDFFFCSEIEAENRCKGLGVQ